MSPSSRPSDFSFSHAGPYRLYSTAELLKLPPPTWLVADVIPNGGFVTMYAPYESYKSFLALDLALCIACDIPWHGHEVQHGFVIYIAAEGLGGLGKRVAAWLQHHNVHPDVPDIAWLTESLPVTADSDALMALLARVEEVRREPAMIVIDTLARCFDGEENETGAMGRFVAGVDVLRHKFKCAALVVHHTGLDQTRARGNTSLGGASDTMLDLKRTGIELVIACAKMKDTEHFEDILLQLSPVEGTDSCVLVASQTVEEQEALAVELLRGCGATSWGAWSDLCKANGIENFVALSARKSIRAQIEKEEGLWRVKQHP